MPEVTSSSATVSTAVLAGILGLLPSRITALKRKGVIGPINPTGRPRYALLESVRRYVEFHRASAGKRMDIGSDELSASKLRKIRSRVEIARQKLTRLESEVSLATDVEDCHGIMNNLIADCLRRFPMGAASELVGVRDLPLASDVLERHAYALLNEIQIVLKERFGDEGKN